MIPAATLPGKKVSDYSSWPRYGAMPRRQAEIQLGRWSRRNEVFLKSAVG